MFKLLKNSFKFCVNLRGSNQNIYSRSPKSDHAIPTLERYTLNSDRVFVLGKRAMTTTAGHAPDENEIARVALTRYRI